MRRVNVSFRFFAPDFSPERNLYLDALRVAGFNAVPVLPGETADICFTSVFVFKSLAEKAIFRLSSARRDPRQVADRLLYHHVKPNKKARMNVWVTGENLRPPSDYDLTLSNEVSDEWNLYFPFIYQTLNWYGADPYPDSRECFVEPAELRSAREVGGGTYGVCAVIGNAEPTRMHALRILRKHLRVDVFGPVSGRPLGSKKELVGRYSGMLCFENDYFPGYVTEKPLEAWMNGMWPIWWGLDSHSIVAPNLLIRKDPLVPWEEWSQEVAERIGCVSSLPFLSNELDAGEQLSLRLSELVSRL